MCVCGGEDRQCVWGVSIHSKTCVVLPQAAGSEVPGPGSEAFVWIRLCRWLTDWHGLVHFSSLGLVFLVVNGDDNAILMA